METCCGYRYDRVARARNQPYYASLGFSRAVGSAPDATTSVALCRNQMTLSPANPIPGEHTPSRRKDNSSRGSRRRLRVRLRCRQRPKPPPHSGSGMLTRFPFGARCHHPERARTNLHPNGTGTPSRQKGGTSPSLRNDSPVSNCCSHGTLLHFSLQGPPLNICYYHQDPHQRPLHPCSRHRLHCHNVVVGTSAPSYYPGQTWRIAHGCQANRRDASAPSIFRAS